MSDSPRVALISGASMGIGRAVAELLSASGWLVALCARSQESLAQVAAEVRRVSDFDPLVLPSDFANPEQIERAVDAVHERWGRIDGLVNNAGSSRFGDFDQLPQSAWKEAYDLKLFGYVHASRCVLPIMRRQQAGAIVNIAGNGGKQVSVRHLIGGSINAAVVHFTKGLAIAYGGDGIRVNAVSPGPVRTERMLSFLRDGGLRDQSSFDDQERQMLSQIPVGRMGTPHEIASVVRFLLSSESSFITGENIIADGGMVRSV